MRGERAFVHFQSETKGGSTETSSCIHPPAAAPRLQSPSPSSATSRKSFYSPTFRGGWCRPHRKQRSRRPRCGGWCTKANGRWGSRICPCTECKRCAAGRSRRKCSIASSRGGRLTACPKGEWTGCWLRRGGCPESERCGPIKRRGTRWGRSCRGLTEGTRRSRCSTKREW